MIRCGAGWTPYLRRALFPSSIEDHTVTFWGVPARDDGLAWLATQPEGTHLDVLGPFGKGFSVHAQDRRLLLVAEAPWVNPLLALIAPQLARQGGVGLLVEAATAADLLPPALLPPAVEYYTATSDRTAGHDRDPRRDSRLGAAMDRQAVRCRISSLPAPAQAQGGFHPYAGPTDSLHAGFAQALAPVPLPCGVGACLACLVNTGRGTHRACQRGPVFDLTQLG